MCILLIVYHHRDGQRLLLPMEVVVFYQLGIASEPVCSGSWVVEACRYPETVLKAPWGLHI